jgi:hypothetical protein
MSLKELGLRAQYLFTFLSSIINTIGTDMYDHFMRNAICTTMISLELHESFEHYEENGYIHDVNLLMIFHLLAYSISYNKWVQS